MKTIQLYLNSRHRFDHSYPFGEHDQEKWAIHNFQAVLDVFHYNMDAQPPPQRRWVWSLVVGLFCAIEGFLLYFFLASIESTNYVLIPILVYVTLFLFVWRYKIMRNKFEATVYDVCERFNATENIRGIQYRFVCERPHWSRFWKATRYVLEIDVDDRFQALTLPSYNQTLNQSDYYTIIIPEPARVRLGSDPAAAPYHPTNGTEKPSL
ncbi:hypothetical protein BC940DRAFT_300805 [Gongronella butleri]|nr:hypothetical protein BC940DRAFT_300805 [Gongronella butleri]